MTLALVIDGVAVPIASVDLAKKGHSLNRPSPSR